jgi:hypothetical protein
VKEVYAWMANGVLVNPRHRRRKSLKQATLIASSAIFSYGLLQASVDLQGCFSAIWRIFPRARHGGRNRKSPSGGTARA